MKLTQRAARVVWVEGHGLLVTDIRGGLHLLDEDFELIRSGRNPESVAPVYAVTTSGDFVYTKDARGTVTQWSLPSLHPVNSLDAHHLRGDGEYLEGEEPSTLINRGICVWQDKLYVNNGYMEIAVIDARTFDLIEVRPSITDHFLEWFCTERPGEQCVADKHGNLYIGDLTAFDFPVHVRLDDKLNLHRVRYDRRHDRYWVTQDAGEDEALYVANGVVVISPDGRMLHNFKFAADDVEALEFDDTFSFAFCAGFEGEITVFDNRESEPRIVRTIAPFRHQITDMTITSRGHLVVLTQDGQMERVSAEGERLARLDFDSRCVWDIQPDPLTEDGYLVATDTGVLAVALTDVEASHPNARVTGRWDLGLGFVRRVRPLADGTFLGVTRSGTLFRHDREGASLWQVPFAPHLHDLSPGADGDRVLVAANEGAFEHDARTGERLRELDLAGLVAWTCAYGPGGELLFGTRNGVLFCFEPSGEQRWRVELGGYCKRMQRHEDAVLVTGGEFAVKAVDVATGKVTGHWFDMLENTVESVTVIGDRVYATSYGLQMAVYETRSPEVLGVVEPFQDFPKALARRTGREGSPRDLLLVGGRGGFLQIRDVTEEGPVLLRTVYLPAGYGK
ncbi:outer membrane protein assembly factor BamB family protein [Streptomyces sp. URMC 124]|uniref:outer membrane protein assembly factor BamB family protein n=1 Tax=Streptomyces sp. URMC 124 TaxID=3423405 RepID=UPI003F1C5C7E